VYNKIQQIGGEKMEISAFLNNEQDGNRDMRTFLVKANINNGEIFEDEVEGYTYLHALEQFSELVRIKYGKKTQVVKVMMNVIR